MPSKAKLVTRATTTTSVSSDNFNKGTALTNAELDSNQINLRDQTIGIVGDDSSGIDIAAGDTLTIAGGTNVTTAVAGNTCTITSSAHSDVFKTISVSGQSDVVADQTSDTLTLVAGSNMTITTNAGTDTITLASSGGGGSIGDLTVTGSTISSPSNADLTLTTSGTGDIIVRPDTLQVRLGGSDFFLVEPDTGTGQSVLQLKGYQATAAIKLYQHQGVVGTPLTTTQGAALSEIITHDYNSGNIEVAKITTTNVATGGADAKIEFSTRNATAGALGVALTITEDQNVETEEIKIVNNTISTKSSNADLELQTSGTGKIVTTSDVLQIGTGVISTDQADGAFQTGSGARMGMLTPTGIQVDAAGDWSYPQVILNSFGTAGVNRNYPVLWATRSGTNTHGANEYLDSGDIAFQFFASSWNGDTDGTGYWSAIASVDMYASEDQDASNRGGGFLFKTINTGSASGATIKMMVDDNCIIQNPKTATGSALTVKGSIRLENASTPSNVANAAHLYAKDDGSGVSHLWTVDEGGVETMQSPHNEKGEWEFYSRNINTGKVLRINMERMIRKLEEFTGATFIETN